MGTWGALGRASPIAHLPSTRPSRTVPCTELAHEGVRWWGHLGAPGASVSPQKPEGADGLRLRVGWGGGGGPRPPSPSAREAERDSSCFLRPEGGTFDETTFVFKPGRKKLDLTKT